MKAPIDYKFHLKMAWIFIKPALLIGFMLFMAGQDTAEPLLKDFLYYAFALSTYLGYVGIDLAAYQKEQAAELEKLLKIVNKVN